MTENLISFLLFGRYFSKPAGESAAQALPIRLTQSGTQSGTQCSQPAVAQLAALSSPHGTAHVHVITRACRRNAQRRDSILTASELVRIIRLQQAAGTLLCVR